MAFILQIAFSHSFSYETCSIVFLISLIYVRRGPINNKPALVQKMTCRSIGYRQKLFAKWLYRRISVMPNMMNRSSWSASKRVTRGKIMQPRETDRKSVCGIHGYNAYHMSFNCAMIGSCTGILSVRCQYIILTDTVNWTQRNKQKHFLLEKLTSKRRLTNISILFKPDENVRQIADQIL